MTTTEVNRELNDKIARNFIQLMHEIKQTTSVLHSLVGTATNEAKLHSKNADIPEIFTPYLSALEEVIKNLVIIINNFSDQGTKAAHALQAGTDYTLEVADNAAWKISNVTLANQPKLS